MNLATLQRVLIVGVATVLLNVTGACRSTAPPPTPPPAAKPAPPAPPPPINPRSSQDTALKNTVEANLSKAGITGLTVEVANGEVTLKGDIPRAKLQDAMKAANEAKPKKVNNQMTIK